jgi:hypothetical protein
MKNTSNIAKAELTESNIKVNLRIVCKDEPTWGVFQVTENCGDGMWMIQGRAGARMLNRGELKFWVLA